MTQNNSERILVAGDVCGNFDTLFKRVSKIMKKHGEFSMLLCTGSFFSSNSTAWEAYKNGTKAVPLQTFILGPNSNEETQYFSNMHMSDLIENVCFLGKVGVFSTSCGVKIAFLSGMESSGRNKISYDVTDVMKLIALCKSDEIGYLGIDVLITSQWPSGVSSKKNPSKGSKLLPVLIKKIMPRYIFCGTEGIWYERDPYRNDSQNEYSTITRFVALGKVGTEEKWIYAVDIKTMEDAKLNQYQLSSYEVSPFKDINLLMLEEKTCQFFFSEPPTKKSKKVQSSVECKPSSPCWFCLSSPKVEKHLIISIGEEAYMTLPKGWLVDNHFIITSIAHYKSTVEAPKNVLEEIDKFKNAVKMYYKHLKCRPIFYERNYKTIHLQINAVPIPEKKCDLLEDIFKKFSEKMSLDIKFYEKSDYNYPSQNKSYFLAELPSGVCIFIEIENRFPLRFDREVLAQEEILNVPDRINWDSCKSTFDEEKSLASHIRDLFKPFDFT